jgi:hypothetical protein
MKLGKLLHIKFFYKDGDSTMNKWNEDFLRRRLGFNWKEYLPPENNISPLPSDSQEDVEVEDIEVLFEQMDYDQLVEDYVDIAMEIKDRDEMRDLIMMLVDEVYSAVEDEVLMNDINDKINYMNMKRSNASE